MHNGLNLTRNLAGSAATLLETKTASRLGGKRRKQLNCAA
jgi:hypothetical protein